MQAPSLQPLGHTYPNALTFPSTQKPSDKSCSFTQLSSYTLPRTVAGPLVTPLTKTSSIPLSESESIHPIHILSPSTVPSQSLSSPSQTSVVAPQIAR